MIRVRGGLRGNAVHVVEPSTALDTAVEEFGVPEVVVYNASIIQSDSVGTSSVRAHLDAWSVNVVGAITAAAHVAPAMPTISTASTR